jgi:hypothetical protein
MVQKCCCSTVGEDPSAGDTDGQQSVGARGARKLSIAGPLCLERGLGTGECLVSRVTKAFFVSPLLAC